MVVEKIQLKDIKLEQLNADCLLAVNRCVRYIKQNHGYSLKLQEKDVLMQLSRLVRKIDDAELDVIYKDLKKKMVVSVNSNRQ